VVQSLAIAMTTAPRRAPTLHRALPSLRGAGFHEDVHMFAEPGTFMQIPPPNDAQMSVHMHATTHGCFGNWRAAIQHLLSHTAAPWLLIMQDDAIWLPGSAEILRDQMRARGATRTGFLSPYVTAKDVSPEFVDGWNEYQGGWNFWGAIALCMRRDAAEELLRHPRFVQHRGSQQVDAVVAASMLDLGCPSFVHVPSLVDHVGETSTIGHDDVAGNLRGHRFGERP
jgi:hypothetical protein